MASPVGTLRRNGVQRVLVPLTAGLAVRLFPQPGCALRIKYPLNGLPAVDVGRRHPAALRGFALEVEFDQHSGLIPHPPPVMAGLDGNHLRSGELERTAVRVLNMDLAPREKPDMCVLAQIGAHDGFHVSGPAETRRIDDALHAAAAGSRHVELD